MKNNQWRKIGFQILEKLVQQIFSQHYLMNTLWILLPRGVHLIYIDWGYIWYWVDSDAWCIDLLTCCNLTETGRKRRGSWFPASQSQTGQRSNSLHDTIHVLADKNHSAVDWFTAVFEIVAFNRRVDNF